MSIDVTMPKLSDTMEEGKILRWAKKVGDAVKTGDVIAEVETDKADMEMEAFDDGVLAEIKVQEGASAPVGAVIAVLAGKGEAAPPRGAATSDVTDRGAAAAANRSSSAPVGAKSSAAASAAAAVAAGAGEDPAVAGGGNDGPAAPAKTVAPRPATKPAAEPKPAPAPAAPARSAPAGDRVKASPLARRIAAGRGVDLAHVQGSGPGGRIVQRDIEQMGGEAPVAPPAASPTTPPVVGTRVDLSRVRRTTARRMADAKRDVPHFYVSFDVAMDECVRLRAQLLDLGARFAGLTYTHLLLRALGMALKRVPELNGGWGDDGIVLHEAVNVGVATATDAGLMVPVARDCDTTPLDALVPAVNALVQRTRDGKPAGNDLSGATFTLSNLGMFPVRDFAAIVNPPQAAILAVGTIRDVPVVRDGRVEPGRVMSATLSCDHRAVDGALAGRFVRELVPLLERPLALVV